MALYQVAWNPTTKTATVATDGTALPGGSTKLNTFNHLNDGADKHGSDFNHVLWHHVRGFLYTIGQWNMQEVSIVSPVGKLIAVQDVDVQEQVETVRVGQKVQLQWSVDPPNADNTGVTFTSSNTAVATVTSAGLVSGVAAGSVQITLTSAEGGKTAVAYVTVVA